MVLRNEKVLISSLHAIQTHLRENIPHFSFCKKVNFFKNETFYNAEKLFNILEILSMLAFWFASQSPTSGC